MATRIIISTSMLSTKCPHRSPMLGPPTPTLKASLPSLSTAWAAATLQSQIPSTWCRPHTKANFTTPSFKSLRSSAKLSIPTSWKKIVWVGHSFGSIVGTQISTNHPAAIDAYIQTGFAIPTPDENALPGELADVYVQASVYDPRSFPPGPYVPGYLVSSSKEGRRNTFYSNPIIDFSPALYDRDFKKKDILTLGEALTQNIYNCTSYTNPVYVLTGKQDAVFCGNGSRLLGTPDCKEELPATKIYYPAVPASKFDYYAQPNAGHCHQLHYTAAAGFAKAHAFLAKMGF